MKKALSLMCEFLLQKNYDIEYNSDFMTVVKRSDDPWNHFRTFTAKNDGVYNYVEVAMGSYVEKKRVSCKDLETARFLLLAWLVSYEYRPSEQKESELISEIKKHTKYVAKNSSDYCVGQCFIDDIINRFS